MPAGPPNLRCHDDGRFETGHVLALAGHGGPPKILHIALQLRAERAVVPKSVDTAVNLRRLKNESSALAEGDNLLHQHVFFGFRHTGRTVFENPAVMSR